MVNSTFYGNHAAEEYDPTKEEGLDGKGGGVYVQATMILANDTDLNGNLAAIGGGLFW